MVGALNGMAGGRYAALDTARQQVDQLAAEELVGPKLKPVHLALPLSPELSQVSSSRQVVMAFAGRAIFRG